MGNWTKLSFQHLLKLIFYKLLGSLKCQLKWEKHWGRSCSPAEFEPDAAPRFQVQAEFQWQPKCILSNGDCSSIFLFIYCLLFCCLLKLARISILGTTFCLLLSVGAFWEACTSTVDSRTMHYFTLHHFYWHDWFWCWVNNSDIQNYIVFYLWDYFFSKNWDVKLVKLSQTAVVIIHMTTERLSI